MFLVMNNCLGIGSVCDSLPEPVPGNILENPGDGNYHVKRAFSRISWQTVARYGVQMI